MVYTCSCPPPKILHQRGELAGAGLARVGGDHGKSLGSFSLLLCFGTFYASGPAPCSFVNGSFTVSASAAIKISRRRLWLLRARILRPNSMRSRVDAPRNRSDGWIANLVSMELATNDSLNSGGLSGRLGPHTENGQGWRFRDAGQSLREHRSNRSVDPGLGPGEGTFARRGVTIPLTLTRVSGHYDLSLTDAWLVVVLPAQRRSPHLSAGSVTRGHLPDPESR